MARVRTAKGGEANGNGQGNDSPGRVRTTSTHRKLPIISSYS